MKAFTAAAAALSLALAPVGTQAWASPGTSSAGVPQYPALDLPDAGGRLGVETEAGYTWNGFQVLKVTRVFPGSKLYSVLQPGDYIYSVNGFNLRSSQDMLAIVSAGAPGAAATVWYVDARNNYTAMKVTVNTVSDAVFGQGVAANAPGSNAGGRDKAFCEEHPFICAAGLIGGAYVVAKAFSGTSGTRSSGGAAAGSSYSRSSNDAYYYRSEPSQPSAPPPAADTSVGCAWGDRAYGTCH